MVEVKGAESQVLPPLLLSLITELNNAEVIVINLYNNNVHGPQLKSEFNCAWFCPCHNRKQTDPILRNMDEAANK